MAMKITGITRCLIGNIRSEASAPRPENTSMPVMRIEAETVGLPSAMTKWAINPTSTMM